MSFKKYILTPPILILFFLMFVLAACSPAADPAETEQPVSPTSLPAEVLTESTSLPAPTMDESEPYPPPVPTVAAYPPPLQAVEPTPAGAGYPAPTDAQPDLPPADPLSLTFAAADGTQLAGTFYAPLSAPAPVVVLMHQFGSTQHQWDDIARWLQTGTPPAGADWLPALPEGLTFAVFTFDFRGHGESEGQTSMDNGLLMDAQAALAFAKTQSGADPTRVITLGTSIGSDGAVDACIRLNGSEIAEPQEHQACLGAMSLSPGNFIGVDYTNAANALLGDPHFATIYCLASEGDGSSPATCNSVTGERYRAVIFPGNAHGVDLLKPGLDPDMGILILEFLMDSLQMRQ